MCQAQELKRYRVVQDLWPSDCCGSSEESEDFEEDTGEDTLLKNWQ